MTLTLSEPKKEKPARAPKPAADAETLRRLAARIEEMKTDRFGELVEELEASEGAKTADKGPALGWQITMAGIRATGTGGLRWAVDSWAMAARRKILEMEG